MEALIALFGLLWVGTGAALVAMGVTGLYVNDAGMAAMGFISGFVMLAPFALIILEGMNEFGKDD